MAAGIEDRIEVFLADGVEPHSVGELFLGGPIGFESTRVVGLKVWRVARRIERRLPALGRRKGDVGTRLFEHVIGCGKFFEPKAGFLAGIPQLVVRGEDHQNVHKIAYLSTVMIERVGAALVR